MKIGIMGGTFNPIHNAHLLIAEMAREEYGLDRVIFITDGNPPHKSANVTAKQRFEMTHIAIADNSAFEEDDFEINRSGTAISFFRRSGNLFPHYTVLQKNRVHMNL